MTYRSPAGSDAGHDERIESLERSLHKQSWASVVTLFCVVGFASFAGNCMSDRVYRLETSHGTTEARLFELETSCRPVETDERERVTLEQDHALCLRTCGAEASSECSWLAGGRRRCLCACSNWAWTSYLGTDATFVVPIATVTENR